jgi:hypothetical protein
MTSRTREAHRFSLAKDTNRARSSRRRSGFANVPDDISQPSQRSPMSLSQSSASTLVGFNGQVHFQTSSAATPLSI